MPDDSNLPLTPLNAAVAQALAALRARTPARLLAGRAGTSYRTATQLELREDHAAAVDAVRTEIDLQRDFDAGFLAATRLFEVSTQAADKLEFLKRPELGRKFSEDAKATLARECPIGVDFQLAIGDGLSAAAVLAQVPALLPLLEAGARARGWSLGRTFAIRYCRVGILNDIGAVLSPRIVVLLIGERPGLATAESLSAYMAFRPKPGHTDADRNLVANIHARGVSPADATVRILALADQMLLKQVSGVAIKEHLPSTNLGQAPAPRLPQ